MFRKTTQGWEIKLTNFFVQAAVLCEMSCFSTQFTGTAIWVHPFAVIFGTRSREMAPSAAHEARRKG